MLSVVRWLLKGAFFALSTVLITQPSQAGAWLQAEDKNQIIFSATWTEANHRFDKNSKPRLSGRFTKQEFSTVFERGWSDTLTIVGGINAKHQAITTPETSSDGLRAHTAGFAMFAGGRLKLWSSHNSVVSFQGTLQGGGERSLPNNQRKLDAPAEADIRLLAGHSFSVPAFATAVLKVTEMPTFVDLQTAYRWRGGSNADEIRIDATLGIKPLPYLQLMLQSFNSIEIAQNKRFGSERAVQHKIQASAVYDVNERWAVQGGIFLGLKGKESLRERGALVAVWRKL
jgi:protein XagA